ncbi:MAG TPA: M56 family metallopeptidase, partial [Chitinophagaceae bacterium]|nr:M56 family metallopeptidase [Chitinophagaceae bacterium]
AIKVPVETSPEPAPLRRLTLGQFMTWMLWLYWFGVIVFALNFLLQVVILLVRSRRNPVIVDGPYRIVEVSGDKAPCSFGNIIFINPEKYDWDTYHQILLHEKVHIRQKHSVDILVAELMLIFQWFNPFAWVYRREIESNLEFLTDDQLMQKEAVEKTSYQLNLLKVSAPHFPLSLTTNYNQSILKKRIAMMNTKRSNLHTSWKYFFLLPVLALFACLLNEPRAKAQTTIITKNGYKKHSDPGAEGYWFAVIKGDKINIRFSDELLDDDDDDNFKSGHSFNGSTFKLSELGTLPRGTSGTFSILREAGKIEMTGKFEDNTGMGKYKFIADKAYSDYMSAELKEKLDEDDQLTFFFINIKKDYLQTLKSEGFSTITKDAIIPMAAMHIDGAYIRSIKDAGFKDVTLEDLIPLKALGIDDKYIQEIRSAGYKNVTTDQLVTFKAQGIDKEYIGKVRQLKGKDAKEADDADDIVSFKSMGIDEDYINAFKDAGLTIPNDQLVSFKALGVTPQYIKSWHDAGFRDIEPDEFVGMKSQNVTPEYLKSFTDMGYKNIKPEDLVTFRALSITPEFIRGFEAMGYKNIDLDELPALKSQNITPEFIKSFEEVGFKSISIDDIVTVKAIGVTPAYIKEMRAKGFNYDKLNKYITLKSID